MIRMTSNRAASWLALVALGLHLLFGMVHAGQMMSAGVAVPATGVADVDRANVDRSGAEASLLAALAEICTGDGLVRRDGTPGGIAGFCPLCLAAIASLLLPLAALSLRPPLSGAGAPVTATALRRAGQCRRAHTPRAPPLAFA